MKPPFVVIVSMLSSLVITGVALAGYHQWQQSDDQLRNHYYESQVATLESPHGIRTAISKGDDSFILVDVRSAQEYEMEHIVGAVNIPIYKDPDTSAYDEVDRVVGAFTDLIAQNPNKKIIVYCYSSSCMSGRKVGRILARNGVFVKELAIGWNEWRYDWNMWNYPHEWEITSVQDYVVAGTEPGEFKGDLVITPCGQSSEFGC